MGQYKISNERNEYPVSLEQQCSLMANPNAFAWFGKLFLQAWNAPQLVISPNILDHLHNILSKLVSQAHKYPSDFHSHAENHGAISEIKLDELLYFQTEKVLEDLKYTRRSNNWFGETIQLSTVWIYNNSNVLAMIGMPVAELKYNTLRWLRSILLSSALRSRNCDTRWEANSASWART